MPVAGWTARGSRISGRRPQPACYLVTWTWAVHTTWSGPCTGLSAVAQCFPPLHSGTHTYRAHANGLFTFESAVAEGWAHRMPGVSFTSLQGSGSGSHLGHLSFPDDRCKVFTRLQSLTQGRAPGSVRSGAHILSLWFQSQCGGSHLPSYSRCLMDAAGQWEVLAEIFCAAPPQSQ